MSGGPTTLHPIGSDFNLCFGIHSPPLINRIDAQRPLAASDAVRSHKKQCRNGIGDELYLLPEAGYIRYSMSVNKRVVEKCLLSVEQ